MMGKQNRLAAADIMGQESSLDAGANRIFNLKADQGREVIKEFLITKIRPDFRQPRRTIPLAVRGEWNGNPDVVGSILQRWVTMAGKELGEDIAVGGLLEGMLDGEQSYTITPDKFPIAHSLMELISLAANIMKDGLIYPITIVEHSKDWMINTGERRWLAHHLLSATVQVGDFKKIKARVVEGSVWVQAAENGSRSPLNAISMARQLSLLIMDMYEGEESFDDYESMVKPGGCDQPYYAQAADLRIKYGYGQRVLDVTGLKSKNQVSQYRSLLTIPEWLWIQADVENWKERPIREKDQAVRGVLGMNTPSSDLDDEVSDAKRLTMVNLSTESTGNQFADALRETFDAAPVETPSEGRAQPTGVTPSIAPGQALGREREKLLTVEDAKTLSDYMLLQISANPRMYQYTDPAQARSVAMQEFSRREDGGEFEAHLHQTEEATERAIESETPLIAETLLRNLMPQIRWAVLQRKNGTLEKIVSDIQTMSLEDIRFLMQEADTEDLEWYQQYLQECFDAITKFFHDELTEFFQILWDEGQRMRVKYPFEPKQ